MRAAETWIFGYIVNSLWQTPLILAAALAMTKLVRKAGPGLEHRIWFGALALEVVTPAFRLDVHGFWSYLRGLLGGTTAGGGEVRVSMQSAMAGGVGALRLNHALIVALLIAYSATCVYFAARMICGWWETAVMERGGEEVFPANDVSEAWKNCHLLFGLSEHVRIAASTMVSGPVTVGIWRKALLVPKGFFEGIDAVDAEAALAHEAAHMARHDFVKNLGYGFGSLPVAYHPAVWMTRARMAESREMICDAMAAGATEGRESYARSLLRLASMMTKTTPARTLHAIGIFDANIFERRVMNLIGRREEIAGMRRAGMAAACVMIGLMTCVSALALHVDVATRQAPPTSLKVDINKLHLIHQQAPEYPTEAKANKDTVDGPVVLSAKINPEGIPVDLQIVKSLRADYDRSAIDAVSQWRWQPYLLNGQPIAVDTVITVSYHAQN